MKLINKAPLLTFVDRIFDCSIVRLFLCQSLVILTASAYSAIRPNIIFVLVDDMGYGDVGAFNPEAKTSTPNLDSLAASGMMFTDAHAPWSSCVPSRYCLLTGRFAFRGPDGGSRWNDWGSRTLIAENRMTFASVLQQNGYHTGMVGKWHLGFNYGDWNNLTGGPADRGFDYYFGISRSLDQADYYYIENRAATQPPTENMPASDGYGQNGWQGPFWRGGEAGSDFRHDEVLNTFRDKSLAFIEEQAADTTSPFFLYLALASPHTPWLPSADFKGTMNTGDRVLDDWGDWVAENDAALGSVIQAVYDKGLRERTLIFFTSDNGPVWWDSDVTRTGHDGTYIYQGMKFSQFEGGHRMPFIASWPGVIQEGSSSDQLINATDMLATFAAIVGEALPDNMAEDSYNIWPALLDPDLQEPVRGGAAIVGEDEYIRQGDWKLIGNDLYNLADDPTEQSTVNNSGKVSDLNDLLQQYRDDGRSTPVNRQAEEIIFGCIDSLYGEFDPDATVQPENACVTLGVQRPAVDYGHMIRYRRGGLEVMFAGNYSITIRSLSGKTCFHITDSGPKFYSLPWIPYRGIYILDIRLKGGQSGNPGTESESIHMKIPVHSDI